MPDPGFSRILFPHIKPQVLIVGRVPAQLTFEEVADPKLWDESLCCFPSPHPMQSWWWGAAKESVGERLIRLLARQNGEPVALAQIFVKKMPFLGTPVAWIPRGPAVATLVPHETRTIMKELCGYLAERNIRFVVSKPYILNNTPPPIGHRVPWNSEMTFWVDLSLPVVDIEKRLHSQYRYAKRRFFREGGETFEVSDDESLNQLVAMYNRLAQRKDFKQYGSSALIRSVWRCFHESSVPCIAAHMFAAKFQGRCIALALILRLRSNAHFMWGAFDYESRQNGANVALHWTAMLKMRELGVTRYDLEGADLKRNPGVFTFKRRLGGKLVELSPYQVAFP